MHEPAAIYAPALVVFDKEIECTQNVILYQGRRALEATLERIKELDKLTSTSLLKGYYYDRKIPSTLSDLCYQAGLASTILFNNAPRGSGENKASFQLRNRRVKYVKDFCDAQNLRTPVLQDRRVRNALTHIDEHLAKALTRAPNVGWFIDTAIETRDQFVAPGLQLKFCRSYIRSEGKIVHLDAELPLVELAHECIALLTVVFGVEWKS